MLLAVFVLALWLLRLSSRFGLPWVNFLVQVLELSLAGISFTTLNTTTCGKIVLFGMLVLDMVTERASLECVLTNFAPHFHGIGSVKVQVLGSRVFAAIVKIFILNIILVRLINPFLGLEGELMLLGPVVLGNAALGLLGAVSRFATSAVEVGFG